MRSSTRREDHSISSALLERLESDKRELAQWRKSRRAGERIPERFWQTAAAYVGELSLSRVSREFGLEYNKLKRLSGAAASLPKECSGEMGQRFIDLTSWLQTCVAGELSGERASPCHSVVFERADGHRLRIEGRLPDVGYVQALMGLFYGG